MRILITGGDGEFCKHLVEQGKKHSFLTPTKKEADTKDPQITKKIIIQKEKPNMKKRRPGFRGFLWCRTVPLAAATAR